MDFFKNLFGSNNNHTFYSWSFQEQSDSHEREDVPRSSRNFDVFSDPLQMHRYFEEEINELLKSFGLQGFGEFSEMPNMPSINDRSQLKENYSEDRTQALRDQFLKRGYEKPLSKFSPKIDEDLDEKVKSGNLEVLLKEDQSQENIPSHNKQNSVNIFMGKSQTMKTITHADGTIETERTIRDSNGNQETTVCQRLGNKEYCIIRKMNKEGQEELTEQFVNMDASEKNIFKQFKDSPSDQPYKFPFDRFFR